MVVIRQASYGTAPSDDVSDVPAFSRRRRGFVATVALCGVALCVAAAALLSTTESEGDTGLLGVQSESLSGMPGFYDHMGRTFAGQEVDNDFYSPVSPSYNIYNNVPNSAPFDRSLHSYGFTARAEKAQPVSLLQSLQMKHTADSFGCKDCEKNQFRSLKPAVVKIKGGNWLGHSKQKNVFGKGYVAVDKKWKGL